MADCADSYVIILFGFEEVLVMAIIGMKGIRILVILELVHSTVEGLAEMSLTVQ
jgi:hypothetical protein